MNDSHQRYVLLGRKMWRHGGITNKRQSAEKGLESTGVRREPRVPPDSGWRAGSRGSRRYYSAYAYDQGDSRLMTGNISSFIGGFLASFVCGWCCFLLFVALLFIFSSLTFIYLFYHNHDSCNLSSFPLLRTLYIFVFFVNFACFFIPSLHYILYFDYHNHCICRSTHCISFMAVATI